IYKGSGFFQHGHTYMGHPVACAASIAVLNAIDERGLIRHVREMGSYFDTKLTEKFGKHPYIGNIRGRGFFWGLEVVKDRTTKEPFDPALKVHSKIKQAAFENGMICYPMGGTIDGEIGDHILLAPPFIAGKEDIDTITDILSFSINSLEK
ncbi:MAG: aminotransferase class III-fold pyridoxal phosphate-dependent enzyme, partial [Pseudomonadota bacterium]|nr:aminotransferase class III-fold pyridoxal phosphate-dependent enzyme [Pseudomonadota bacterium]